MKVNLKWFGVMSVAILMAFACGQQDKPKDKTDDDTKKDEVIVPDKQEVTLQVGPEGSTTLTTDVEAYADWTVSPDENYKWISVSPESGSKGQVHEEATWSSFRQSWPANSSARTHLISLIG